MAMWSTKPHGARDAHDRGRDPAEDGHGDAQLRREEAHHDVDVDVLAVAPSRATRRAARATSVRRVASPRSPPMSIRSDAFWSQLRRFEKYSTPPLAQSRPEARPDEHGDGHDDVLPGQSLLVGRVILAHLGAHEAEGDQAEHDGADEPAEDEPRDVLSPAPASTRPRAPSARSSSSSATISAMSTAAASLASRRVHAASKRASGAPQAAASVTFGSSLALTPSSIPGSVMRGEGYCERRTASSKAWALNVLPRRRARVSAATLAQAASSAGVGS